MGLTIASEAGTAEQKRTQERKRNIIVLIMQHLFENGEYEIIAVTKFYVRSYEKSVGYLDTAERLQQEAGLALGKVLIILFEICYPVLP